MNKNVLIVLAGGFVVAILVAVLVQASLGGKKQVETGPKLQVLVAAKMLPLGKELAEGDLKWQTWPGDKAFASAIVRKNDQKADEALTGRLIERVNEGQPLLSTYVFKEGRGNVVAAVLPKGMRGMAIPVKAFTMAGGFITPGDYVDVILTYKVSVNRRDQSFEMESFLNSHASETILKNIRILAVDQEASREKDDAKVAKTVTLAVTSKQAETLAVASEMGDIILSLRGIGDEDDENTDALTTDVEVSRAMQNMVNMKESEMKAPSIKIYSGATMVETKTKGAERRATTINTEAEPEVEETSEGVEE